MLKLVPLLAVILTLLGCASKNVIKENQEFYLGGFDGVFVGDIQQLKGTGYPFVGSGHGKVSFKLAIRDNKASLFIGTPEKGFNEVYLDNPNIIRHKTNAVIYSQGSESEKYNEEDKGNWVETWNMTLTRKNKNSIYVYIVRSVNNFRLPPETYIDDKMGRFFYSWSGELQQVAVIERAPD